MIYLLEDVQLERLQAISNRLHNGTDRERDEGHRLWLVLNAVRELDIEESTLEQAEQTRLLNSGLCNDLARKQYQLRAATEALQIAMSVLQETAISTPLYAMHIDDPEHPWHEDIKKMRELMKEMT